VFSAGLALAFSPITAIVSTGALCVAGVAGMISTLGIGMEVVSGRLIEMELDVEEKKLSVKMNGNDNQEDGLNQSKVTKQEFEQWRARVAQQEIIVASLQETVNTNERNRQDARAADQLATQRQLMDINDAINISRNSSSRREAGNSHGFFMANAPSDEVNNVQIRHRGRQSQM
jgi:hypothetical protein